ncbi:methionine synthase [Thermithiobacillus tepidarius DSM 3134]|uniref:methionine synthase n=1 Tax=Thermithiobacillus tepidarius TaxID=929 RepID=UPI001B7F9C85|nr:methionine synthase [Thermithiobacillus tepidarius]
MERLRERVLIADGGMGTSLHTFDLDLDKDYWGLENCSEVLVLSRPDVVAAVHKSFFDAGSDCVETDTFGANKVVLAEFGLSERTFEINEKAAQIARGVADALSTPEWPRFVIGSIGPGTKLPSLGHTSYDVLEDSYAEQARGLIAGGVDLLLIETAQDILQVKAAVNGCKIARAEAGMDVPIFAQVTIETTGTMLVGTDIAAAATAIHALGVDGMGMNCATGPAEMSEHVRWLGENWPHLISVMPNAGLPMLVEGQTVYPLGPRELADWMLRYVEEDGVNLVGGCCGTTPEHIRALREAIGFDRRPRARSPEWVPAVSSLYSQVPLRQENAVLAVGERANANGSKKFRELLAAEDWDAMVGVARDQVKEGSHVLDVCTAYVGRPEVADMQEVVNRYRGQVTVPLMIDSTEVPVLEAALKLLGGKSIINSINFEDGEEKAERVLGFARKYGAAVVALTIDEEGMAKEVEQKLAIAHRLYDFAVKRYGLPASDLIYDPLTFTICTGVEEDRRHGINTLEAIERIRRELPECQIMLGLSNISFGLKPAARHVLNSVFLHHAQKRGLTAAIIHVAAIKPLHQIPPEHVEAAEDLIFDRRDKGFDPLLRFVELFKDVTVASAKKAAPATVEERLTQRIVDGDKQGLEDDLKAALEQYPPLEIINTFLLDGMKVVGELFGSGQMQLPFVLQSAETMKAAVAFLEPFMEKVEGEEKGILVLATVKGDVHDIGKNLVDIILTNNGYKVVNLGIKQPIDSIVQAACDCGAHAIGMSGLLVKSTVIMKENLEEMRRRGLDIPVLLGGAALTRRFVENDCRAAYGHPERVHYAKDAFEGLKLMEQIMAWDAARRAG